MAKSEQRAVDLTSDEPPPNTIDIRSRRPTEGGVLVGSMTIEFRDYDGNVVPSVQFAPVGRINPNTLERNLSFIYREIQRAQVAARRGGTQ